MKKKAPLAIAAIAALGLASLTACSDSGVATSGDESGLPADSVINVGVSSIQSGPAASSGLSMTCVIESYLEDANESGGINGYTFNVISRDHQYDASRAASIAREFVQEDVFAMATDGTATMNAALPVIEPQGIPVFATADGAVFAPPEYDRMFGINPDYGREAAGGAKFILDELGETKAAIAYVNSEAGEPAAEAFPKYFEANGGEVVASESIASTNSDYTAQANNLKNSGAEVVYTFLLDTGLAALQKAASSIGYSPTWVSWFPVYTPSYLDLAGDLSEGTYVSQFSTPLSETDDPGVENFLRIVGDACEDSVVTAQAAQSAASFAEGILTGVQRATDGGGELTKESFSEALTMSGEPLGVTPSVTWDSDTHAGATKAAAYRIEGGELTEVTEYEELPEID